MAEEQRIGSILLADCGTVMTKAVLLEQVTGQYRFIAKGEAPTTAEYPWSDVGIGIRQAVEQISESTGRRFFDANGDLISPEATSREGVDAFAATASASQPLRVVLGGLVRDLSVASIQRAAAGTYSTVEGILAGDGQDSELTDESRARMIRDAAPDVICIAGGTEGGAAAPVLKLVDTAALACSLMEQSARSCLLYAGNSRLRRQVVRIVDQRAELRVADNVRPTPTEEDLLSAQEELDKLYVQSKMGQLPGVSAVSVWSAASLTPTARAFGRLMQYLWHLGDHSRGVLGVDIGAASTTLVAVFDGQVYTTIRGDLGITFGGERLIRERGADIVTRWLPEAINADDARGTLINKEIHPASIPQELHELRLDHALAREAIRTTLTIARPGWQPGGAQLYPHLLPLCDTIVVSGGALAHAPRPGQVALIALDALEPIGVSTLVLDSYGLASALGNVAAIKPLAAVEALDSGALTNLGTVVAPVGRARHGEIVLKVQVTYENGGTFDVDVAYGDLEVLPLPPGQQAILELRPQRHFDVGLGGPGKAGKRRVSGGLAGLIIDARGRPLHLLGRADQRQSQMQQWLWDVGG